MVKAPGPLRNPGSGMGQLKIFYQRMPVANLSDVGKAKPGEVFPRLVGINIARDDGWLDVEPIYLAVVRFTLNERYVVIEIGWSRPLLAIVLQRAWPPVFVQRIEGEEVKERDE